MGRRRVWRDVSSLQPSYASSPSLVSLTACLSCALMRARCPATSDREPVDGLSLPRRRYRGYPSSRRHQGSLSFRQYCSEPTKSSVMDRRNSRSRCSSLETSASGHPAYNLGPVILLQLAHALVAQAWSITVLSAP